MYRKFAIATILLMLVATIIGGCKAATRGGAYTLKGGTTAATSQTNTANATTVSNLTDLNGDGIVDIKDITLVAKAFGSTPGSSNWNPNADLNNDGKIDMEDIVLVVGDFGKTVAAAPLTFEKILANTKIAGRPVQLTCAVNSNTNVSSYVYSWNNTGTWQNQTAVAFSNFINSTEANATYLGTWNSFGGDTVAVTVFVNDTEDNWAQSPQYNFTLVTLPSSVTSSENWAGIVTVADTQNSEPIVFGVSASWTIPSVTSHQGATYSALWIGIGGFSNSDRTLIQTGTEQDSVWGQTTYSAWYELLPNYAITINLNVKPGDRINASILLTDSNTNQWLISIADLTTGQQYQKQVVYISSQLSAEWIVERPSVGGRIGNLANFGSVTFTNCQTTLQALTGTISDFPSVAVTMYQNVFRGNGLTQLAVVSDFSNDGSSFKVSEQQQGIF